MRATSYNFTFLPNSLSPLKGIFLVFLVLLMSGCAIQPKVVTEQENKLRITQDLLQLQKNQDPVQGAISLEEATARALKHNLDLQIELRRKSLVQKQLNLTSYDMLPKLVIDLNYNARDNFSGANSRSLITGLNSLESSTSSDRDVFSAALGLSWSLLDFGVSYYRAQQAGDKVLIQEEQKRKVVNRIVQDVRTAYWRAISNERLNASMEKLRVRLREAIDQTDEVLGRKLNNPSIALTYQRELLGIERELGQLQRNMALAKAQLAALMNLKPGEKFVLVIPERGEFKHKLDLKIEEMEQIALESRPELRELFYEKRANAKETRAAILQMLPGIELGGNYNYSSNSFLFNSDWMSLGAQLAWNLVSLVSLPAKLDELEAKEQLLDAERLSMSMAVLTQLHVSLAQFSKLMEEHRTALQYQHVQKRIMDQTQIEADLNKVSQHVVIREEMNTLLAEVRYNTIYAELENAYAAIYASMGLDPLPANLDAKDLTKLTSALSEHWSKR